MTSRHAYLRIVVLTVSALVIVAAACLGLLMLSKDSLLASQNLQVGQNGASGTVPVEPIKGFFLHRRVGGQV